MTTEFHQPVMVREVLEAFEEMPLKVFFDGTVGAGGHALEILKMHPELETYIACDRDPSALEIAKETLKPYGKKVQFVHSNHENLENILSQLSISGVDGFFLI